MIDDALAALTPLEKWSQQCHAASLMVINALGRGRVARGTCRGVGGQHSWVVLGDDCYAPDAKILDPTLWSYDKSVTGIWTGFARDGRHRPFGSGWIWDWGRPATAKIRRNVIALTPTEPLSGEAERFLKLLGPLDRTGWDVLAHAPVEGWPAGEILAAMDDTEAVTALVPIDTLGMVTNRNPGGLYLPARG